METHQRHSIRLKEYDYSQAGGYFVTVCTSNGKPYFEQYQSLRDIINKQWYKIPNRYHNTILDEFVIMPNHIHGIIIIIDATLQGGIDVHDKRAGARPAPTIGEIVGTFKSSCINDWLKYIKMNELNADGKFWQRNYYEHVIRNESELNRIREYIIINPLKWRFDRENPCRTTDTKYETEWQWLEGDL